MLGFLRNALGTPSMPPNQVLVGIALFLSLFVMAPTLHDGQRRSPSQPYLHHQIDEATAIDRGQQPLRAFMLKQTRDSDLALFVKLAQQQRAEDPRRRADLRRWSRRS